MKIVKRDIKYYLFLGLLLMFAVFVELFREKPIDWKFYLERKSTEPYGTYLLYKCLPDIFTDINENKKTLYTNFKNKNPKNTNLIIITKSLQTPENELNTLLNYVANGNVAFLSSFYFVGKIADTLKINTNLYCYSCDSTIHEFTNPQLKDSTTVFGKKFENHYFSLYDTTKAEILARDNNQNVSFYRIPYKKGYFYLHSRPDIFTNYAFITEKKAGYAFSVLSHLPRQETIWDEYYKPYKKQKNSILRYIFEQDALKYGWYTLVVLITLFVLFYSKRTQRIIPVITPLKNTSAEFAETLANLYYSKKNHRQIAKNRILYFMDEISKHFFIPPAEIQPKNIEFLTEKTGLQEKFWTKFFNIKNDTENENLRITGKFLMDLDLHLETYYQHRK